MRCCAAVEKAVDGFDFLQDSERFGHRLNWALRQMVTAYIAERLKAGALLPPFDALGLVFEIVFRGIKILPLKFPDGLPAYGSAGKKRS